MASLLNVNVPAAKLTGASSGGDGGDGSTPEGEGKPRRRADEMESYENLVRTVGY